MMKYTLEHESDHLNVVVGCFGAEQIDNEDCKAKSLDILPKTGKRTKALVDKEAKNEVEYDIKKDLDAFSREEQMEVVYSNGSKTEYNNFVSDPLLIRDGSETESNNYVSDPLLIRDESETESNNSVSDPLLIRDGSEAEYNYNCTL
ncbi:hypothetical protein Syun_016580 [Stephania yunnanensis]|uniref:Uncharacterized protein n=1 Tax=Stephania yunnanensis TaxID=152371 RepID=A0AAP0J5H4_9MAGN